MIFDTLSETLAEPANRRYTVLKLDGGSPVHLPAEILPVLGYAHFLHQPIILGSVGGASLEVAKCYV